MTSRISRVLQRMTMAIVAAAALSCHHATAPKTAKVQWKLDAPLCGGLTFRFEIDHVEVGTVMLSHNGTTPLYSTSVGEHSLSTNFTSGGTYRDTTVTLRGGQTYTDVVSFYCS